MHGPVLGSTVTAQSVWARFGQHSHSTKCMGPVWAVAHARCGDTGKVAVHEETQNTVVKMALKGTCGVEPAHMHAVNAVWAW